MARRKELRRTEVNKTKARSKRPWLRRVAGGELQCTCKPRKAGRDGDKKKESRGIARLDIQVGFCDIRVTFRRALGRDGGLSLCGAKGG